MLHTLSIKNIALISEASIEFDEKFNVLSGETGSGKSVILDSINFVLGSKADKTMIRYGEQEAIVRAEFVVKEDSEAAETVRSYDIETDGTILITRKLNVDGRGNIKINGVTVTATMLKAVTQHLVDVHGQSEHFFLLNEDNQLKLLDGICGESAAQIKRSLSELIAKNHEVRSKISRLGGDPAERERKLDLLKFQIDEIECADLREGEYDELKVKQNLIANTEKIISALSLVREILSADGGCIDNFNTAKHSLNQISSLNDNYANVAQRIEEIGVEALDISETVSDLIDELSFDEREAAEIEERLELIKRLKRKYGADEAEILKFLQHSREQFDALSDAANFIEKLSEEELSLKKEIFGQCKKLTELRKECAEKFCKAVVAELKTLNIPDAKFCVTFEDYDFENANLNSPDGTDKIIFMFSANKGEPLKPLSKVISGGEMSRFMLAVKTQIKNLNGISTYIFDEIDAGISGFTANTVAKKFVSISKDTQIIAVSHLPQVCAASDTQFLINKSESNGKTLTNVYKLDANSKIKELVRLMGSVDTQSARRHAEELISEFKK